MLIYINHDDMRSLELMEECIRRGYYVSDQLKDLKYADVIYLGSKGLDRKNRLLMNNETVLLTDDIFQHFKEGSIVLTLCDNAYLEELSILHGFQYSALLKQEDFINKNAILTAEGLLSYLISHRIYPIFDCHIMVLGFGHCALPIIQYLKALGANVDVVTRNKKQETEIQKLGCQYVYIDDINLKDIDLLINTIPHVVVKEKELDKASSRLMIVDIASYPYGILHHYALAKGINSIILPSLPSKYAYGYAGQMMIDEIERLISIE